MMLWTVAYFGLNDFMDQPYTDNTPWEILGKVVFALFWSAAWPIAAIITNAKSIWKFGLDE